MVKIPTTKDKIIFLLLTALAILFGVLNVINLYDAVFNSYKPAKYWKTYSDKRVTFQYPEEWNPKFCGDQPRPFKLPKVIKGDLGVDGRGGHPIKITGRPYAHREYCQDNSINFEYRHWNRCDNIQTSGTVIKLNNGMLLTLDKDYDRITHIDIKTSECAWRMFTFSLSSATIDPADGPVFVGVSEKQFINSPQYKDIVKFAESIKIKEQ